LGGSLRELGEPLRELGGARLEGSREGIRGNWEELRLSR